MEESAAAGRTRSNPGGSDLIPSAAIRRLEERGFVSPWFLERILPSLKDNSRGVYVDKITSGFLIWEPALKAYIKPRPSSPLSQVWEQQSRPVLDAVESIMKDPTYFSRVLSLWAQESDAKGTMSVDLDLRYGIAS